MGALSRFVRVLSFGPISGQLRCQGISATSTWTTIIEQTVKLDILLRSLRLSNLSLACCSLRFRPRTGRYAYSATSAYEKPVATLPTRMFYFQNSAFGVCANPLE